LFKIIENVQSSITSEEVSTITNIFTNLSESVIKPYMENSINNLYLFDAANVMLDFVEDSIKSSTLFDLPKYVEHSETIFITRHFSLEIIYLN
jgi:hypothetical protein